MSITKDLLLNWHSLMKKRKKKKDSDDFLHRKLTLKGKFLHFLTPPYYTNSQNSIFFFGYVNFYAKIFLISYPQTWNFITCIAIVEIPHHWRFLQIVGDFIICFQESRLPRRIKLFWFWWRKMFDPHRSVQHQKRK